MRSRIAHRTSSFTRGAFVAWVLASATSAWAEHDHGPNGHGPDEPEASTYVFSLGVLAASYEAMLYTGNYQGATVSAGWSRKRFAASLSVPWYRLEKNGKAVHGLGDLFVHGQATALTRGEISAGAVLGISVPTGDHDAGLGMGHVMVMPSLWARWAPGRLVVAISAGYGQGIGDRGTHAHHGNSAWPLVDPMSFSELMFGSSADVALAGGFRAGARARGAIPTGDGGSRLFGGVRVAFARGRIEASLEAQAGIIGEPFGVRGVFTTSVRFP